MAETTGAGAGSGKVRRVAVAGVMALMGLAIPVGAAGQIGPSSVAAPYLAPDHWALDALRRLDALGLLGGRYDPGLAGIDRVEAAWLLGAALREAESERAEMVPVVEGYRARFAAQYPAASGRVVARPAGPARGGSEVSAGLSLGDPELLTSVGTPPIPKQPWVPEQPAEFAAERRDPRLAAQGSGYWGRHLAAQAGVALEGGEARLLGTQLVAAVGPVHGWAGRRRLSIGHGDGGVIVSGSVPMDGAGISTAPFHLPWVLDRLGQLRVATSLGRLERAAPHDDPWLWLFRTTVAPHPRLILGLNRAAMAVTVDGSFDDRLRQIAYIAIGKHAASADDNMRDNQMASVDLRYRPPLGSLPVSLYIEWGLDDSAGSWKDVPGIVAGAYLGAVPGAPWLAAGMERAHFAERCCGNIWWYRHSGFTGGWTDERRALGHPLGGHGDEWAGRLDATLFDAAALVRARGYFRDRGDENLFAPTFQGESTGGSIDVRARPRAGTLRSLELGVGIEYEAGEEWSRVLGEIRIGVLF